MCNPPTNKELAIVISEEMRKINRNILLNFLSHNLDLQSFLAMRFKDFPLGEAIQNIYLEGKSVTCEALAMIVDDPHQIAQYIEIRNQIDKK